MRVLASGLLAAVLFLAISCNKSSEAGDICSGLLQNGSADSVDFRKLGSDWWFTNFSYTPDGKEIKFRDTAHPGYLRTTGTDTLIYRSLNEGAFIPTFFSGTNDLKMRGWNGGGPYNLREALVFSALQDAICYTIKGDMLYIHFKEREGSNLLVLQRR